MRWLLIFALFAASAAHADCDLKRKLLDHPEFLQSQARFHDYEVRVYSARECDDSAFDGHPGGFVILKSGKPVHSETGFSFAIGYALAGDQSPDSAKLEVGDDITGEGVPDLLISEDSGGAHCCYTFHIFQLGSDFKEIQEIPLFDADESAFVQRKGVKGLVLHSADFSDFAYFPAGFALSPAGRVLLSFQGGAFRLDKTLMRSNAPKPEAVAKCAALFRQSRDWKGLKNAGQPYGMWFYSTDLIYTGHADQAWKFLDAAWGGSKADKDKYLGDYKRLLTKSVYYPDLMLLQQAPLTDAGQKIDWDKHCFDYMHG